DAGRRRAHVRPGSSGIVRGTLGRVGRLEWWSQPGVRGGDTGMKTLMAVTAAVVGLTFAAGTATANMCPTLVKQGRDAAAKMDANSDKVKKAVSMLDKA